MRKLIKVDAKNTKPFKCGSEEAFRLLFTMIMNDKETRFLFGATSEGSISLYINSRDFCKTISEYKYSDKPEDIFNENYFGLDSKKQEELLIEHYQNPMNIHQSFMKEYGDEAKLTQLPPPGTTAA